MRPDRHFSFHLISKQNVFLFVLVISIIFSFIKLGGESIADWDEARNGVNAFEMLNNHDYINLFYNQQLDTWNNKPPLLIWLIVLSYKIFGFSEFALRLPSAIATVVFFVFFFKTICLYEKPLFAALACIILFSTKGIIGMHAGRTGDFDALLTCFLMMATYFFLLYVEFLKPLNIYFSSAFLGFAFLSKGTASLFLVPGYIIYLLSQKKIKAVLFNRHTLFGVLLYLIFAGCWIFCVTTFGKNYDTESSEYHSSNAIETLFVHDTIHRFTKNLFHPGYHSNWTYFFTVMDAKLNLWNYLFYLTIIVLIFKIFKISLFQSANLLNKENKLFAFSLIQVLTSGMILALAINKLPWYLTPALPFAAIVTAYGARYFYYSFRFFKIILAILILFTLSRHFIYLIRPHTELKDFFSKNKLTIEKYNKIYIVDQPSQSFFLYVKWNFDKVVPAFNVSQNNMTEKNAIFCINRDNPKLSEFKTTDCFNNHCFAKKVSEPDY